MKEESEDSNRTSSMRSSALKSYKEAEAMDQRLRRALQSEFCHIRKVIDDMYNIINSNNVSILNDIIELKNGNYVLSGFLDYVIDGFYLNRYSEVFYILYTNNGNNGLLPIKPSSISKKYNNIPKY